MFVELEEKAVKETLKKIIDNDDTFPHEAKMELKMIIESEHNPEKLLQKCLLYTLFYKG